MIRSICYGNGLYVVGGDNGKLATSIDGINWIQRDVGFDNSMIRSICYGNGLYVVGGDNGKLATSIDGINWIQRDVGFGIYIYAEIYSICYSNGLYIIGGGNFNGLIISSDGINWIRQNFNSKYDGIITSIVYGDNLYVAGGWYNIIITFIPEYDDLILLNKFNQKMNLQTNALSVKTKNNTTVQDELDLIGTAGLKDIGVIPGTIPIITDNGKLDQSILPVITKDDLGLGNISNESKDEMFTSPDFTGTPTAPTANPSTNNNQIATTKHVKDTIEYSIATQLEAETGAINNKLMTPLRVRQYVTKNSGAGGVINVVYENGRRYWKFTSNSDNTDTIIIPEDQYNPNTDVFDIVDDNNLILLKDINYVINNRTITLIEYTLKNLESLHFFIRNTSYSYSNLIDTPTLGTVAEKNTGTTSGTIPIIDINGKLDQSILPALAITDTFPVASQASMLALSTQVGDVAIRTDLSKSFILKAEPATVLANWQELLTPTDAVQSVNGKVGAVSLTKSDIGLPNVTDIEQAAKVHTHATTDVIGLDITIGNAVNAKIIKGSGTILTTGWATNTGEYVKKLNIIISGVTSTDVVNMSLSVDGNVIAQEIELCPTTSSYNGGVTIYAKEIPSVAINFEYIVIK